MTAPADAAQGTRPAPPLAPLLEQLAGGEDLTA
jgi:hypothetical protein